MTQASLLSASAMATGAAGAYAYLAIRLREDARDPTRGAAVLSFATWWATLAVNLVLVAVTYVLAGFGALPFEVQLAVSVMQRILLALGVAALLRYLLYLRTGRDLLLPLGVIYGAYLALAFVSMFIAVPDAVFVGEWRTELSYAEPPPAWTRLLSLLVVLPSFIASFAYFLLYYKVEDPGRRYRIAVVSWAIVGWWALAIVAGQRPLLDIGWLQALNRAASVLTALLVLSAYHPPRFLTARFARAEDHRFRREASR